MLSAPPEFCGRGKIKTARDMTYSQKRFCVLTTGRAGSTARMKALGKFEDIAVPSKNVACPDEELLSPGRLQEYLRDYSRLCSEEVRTEEQLIDSFFRCNAAFRFCGFKSMPERHKDYGAFVHMPGIQFITLSRLDVASTVASFIAAMKFKTWRRDGGAPAQKWTFRAGDDAGLVRGNLAYVYKSLLQLDAVPNAIRITYEDICEPDFQCAALDNFFERRIRIENPKQPTRGQEYLTNWEEFRSYIDRTYAELKART